MTGDRVAGEEAAWDVLVANKGTDRGTSMGLGPCCLGGVSVINEDLGPCGDPVRFGDESGAMAILLRREETGVVGATS